MMHVAVSGCEDRAGWQATINKELYTSCLAMLLEYPSLCLNWDYAKDGCCATCHMYGAVTPTQHGKLENSIIPGKALNPIFLSVPIHRIPGVAVYGVAKYGCLHVE